MLHFQQLFLFQTDIISGNLGSGEDGTNLPGIPGLPVNNHGDMFIIG